MFWKFILVAALAVGLLQLGAFSVWVFVLKVGLAFSVLVICGLFSLLWWRKASAKSNQKRSQFLSRDGVHPLS